MQTTWLTSTIAFELQNEAYEDDHLMRRLSAVKENVQVDEIQAVGEALASLHDDDQFIMAELTTKSVYNAK
ncbi:hypothetical protein [Latilactobacillus sakei]|uniref:DUF1659 domain-containing protein n=1 Tax=Latilactobacillus sakei TaxID=1599 RepID=A0AAE8LVK8_LATSK|nr:hypothetical protein [Latilactobacillus sakei]SPE20464.1 hypothetical protein LAS9267_00850 [Latilactobacillus sakei]